MIVQDGTPEGAVLRQTAREIREDEFGTPELLLDVEKMIEVLATQDDGVAIAAPQIGKSLRIFAVAHDVIRDATEEKVFINPVIKKQSREKEFVPEGCLSVRWKYGEVERSVKATVEAFDQYGNKFQMSGSGLLAQIFQHEVDHLNGVLFIDKAENIRDEPPRA